jgi:hypothetical protein
MDASSSNSGHVQFGDVSKSHWLLVGRVDRDLGLGTGQLFPIAERMQSGGASLQSVGVTVAASHDRAAWAGLTTRHDGDLLSKQAYTIFHGNTSGPRMSLMINIE